MNEPPNEEIHPVRKKNLIQMIKGTGGMIDGMRNAIEAGVAQKDATALALSRHPALSVPRSSRGRGISDACSNIAGGCPHWRVDPSRMPLVPGARGARETLKPFPLSAEWPFRYRPTQLLMIMAPSPSPSEA